MTKRFKYNKVLQSYTMETVCVKLEESLLTRMDKQMKEAGYSTKTEFIREAIRIKLEEDEQEKLIKEFLTFKGKAQKETTYQENKKTREAVVLELARERGWQV